MCILSYSSTAQDNALDYINTIISFKSAVTQKSLYYTMVAVHSNDEAIIESARQEVVSQIDNSINAIDKMDTYKGK